MLEVKNKKSIKFQVDLRPEYAFLIGLLKNKREFVEKLLVRTALNDKDEFYKPFSAPNEVAKEIVEKYYHQQDGAREQVKREKIIEIAETEKAKRIEVAEQEQKIEQEKEIKQEIKIEAIDIKKQVARPQLNIASFD